MNTNKTVPLGVPEYFYKMLQTGRTAARCFFCVNFTALYKRLGGATAFRGIVDVRAFRPFVTGSVARAVRQAFLAPENKRLGHGCAEPYQA